MKPIAILLIIFGIIIMIAPEILAYLIGGFFIFVGLNILSIGLLFNKKQGFEKENYVKFGKYKIFR